jgi:ArsR family transcriptional regulator, arsenate/arsenite/antimonite-responsive transcriptional repressor
MAINKKEEFTNEEQELAEFAKAIAHPARIAILKVLAQKQSCICGEIVEVLPLAQSTVSQHLKELKNAGLIQGTIEGAKSCYCIDPEKFRRFRTTFDTLFALVKNSGCC